MDELSITLQLDGFYVRIFVTPLHHNFTIKPGGGGDNVKETDIQISSNLI